MKNVIKEPLLGGFIAFLALMVIVSLIAFQVSGFFHLDSIQDVLRLITIVLSTPIYFVVALKICIQHGVWSVLIGMLLSILATIFILQTIKKANPIKLRYQVATYLIVIGGVGAYCIQLVGY